MIKISSSPRVPKNAARPQRKLPQTAILQSSRNNVKRQSANSAESNYNQKHRLCTLSILREWRR